VPIVTNGRGIGSSSRLSLGQKDSPEACIAVAKDEPACIGGEVAVSSWGCYCLKNVCYASSNSYYTSSYYDLYRYEECQLPTDIPSLKPSTFPSFSPNNNPSQDISDISDSPPGICSVLNGQQCRKIPQKCIWETVTKSCYGNIELPACSVATKKTKCAKLKIINSKCAWSAQSKTCGELDCSDYDGSWKLCNKIKAGCKWENVTKTCLGIDKLPLCSNLTKKRLCKSKNYSAHCVWSKSEEACKDK